VSHGNGITPWMVVYLGPGEQDMHLFEDLHVTIDGKWTGNGGDISRIPVWSEL
jgi:hypothetical protein